jgi:hypothetical protein
MGANNVSNYLAIADTYHDFNGDRCSKAVDAIKTLNNLLNDTELKNKKYYPENEVMKTLVTENPDLYNFEEAYDVTDIIDNISNSPDTHLPNLKFMKYTSTGDIDKGKFTSTMQANFGKFGVIVDTAPKQPFEFTNPDAFLNGDASGCFKIISICSFWDAASRSMSDGLYITNTVEWTECLQPSDPPSTTISIPISGTPFQFEMHKDTSIISLIDGDKPHALFEYTSDDNRFQFPIALNSIQVKGVSDLCTSTTEGDVKMWVNTFNIKRSQDYGQVQFAKALNDAGMTCFLQTHDRLCFMKALEQNVPAIFFRNNLFTGIKTFFIHVGDVRLNTDVSISLLTEIQVILNNQKITPQLTPGQIYKLNKNYALYAKESTIDESVASYMILLETYTYINATTTETQFIPAPAFQKSAFVDYDETVQTNILHWSNLLPLSKFHVYNYLFNPNKIAIYNMIKNKTPVDLYKSVPLFDVAQLLDLDLEKYDIDGVSVDFQKFSLGFTNAIQRIAEGRSEPPLKQGISLLFKIKKTKADYKQLVESLKRGKKYENRKAILKDTLVILEKKRTLKTASHLTAALVMEQGFRGVESISKVQTVLLEAYNKAKDASLLAFQEYFPDPLKIAGSAREEVPREPHVHVEDEHAESMGGGIHSECDETDVDTIITTAIFWSEEETKVFNELVKNIDKLIYSSEDSSEFIAMLSNPSIGVAPPPPKCCMPLQLETTPYVRCVGGGEITRSRRIVSNDAIRKMLFVKFLARR